MQEEEIEPPSTMQKLVFSIKTPYCKSQWKTKLLQEQTFPKNPVPYKILIGDQIDASWQKVTRVANGPDEPDE